VEVDVSQSGIEPVQYSGPTPALAKVKIYELAKRPGFWLLTDAWVDDRVYVGSREWRQQQLDSSNSTRMKPG
jgi:hypothetical protein